MLRLRSWGICLAAGLLSVLLMGGYPSTDCRDYQTDGGNGGDPGWPPYPPPTHTYKYWYYAAPPGGWPPASLYPEAEMAALSICESVYPADSLVARINTDLQQIGAILGASYSIVMTPFAPRWSGSCVRAAMDTAAATVMADSLSVSRWLFDSLALTYLGSYCSLVKEINGASAWMELSLMRKANLALLPGLFLSIPVFDTVSPCYNESNWTDWPPLCLLADGNAIKYYFIGPCVEPHGSAEEDCVYYFNSSGSAVSFINTTAFDNIWQSPASRPKWVDTFIIARNNWRLWPMVVRDDRP